ncbi:hypothetical protein GCM10020255_052820 [Rhodococcus baikonurensis]
MSFGCTDATSSNKSAMVRSGNSDLRLLRHYRRGSRNNRTCHVLRPTLQQVDEVTEQVLGSTRGHQMRMELELDVDGGTRCDHDGQRIVRVIDTVAAAHVVSGIECVDLFLVHEVLQDYQHVEQLTMFGQTLNRGQAEVVERHQR